MCYDFLWRRPDTQRGCFKLFVTENVKGRTAPRAQAGYGRSRTPFLLYDPIPMREEGREKKS